MRKRNLDIEKYILDNLRDNPTNITQMIIQEFNVSRQTANNYLVHLINDRKVKATGNTKAREYHLLPIIVKKFTYMIQPTLEEDRVWLNDIAIHLEDIEKSAKSICQYCFTEIFNNAISHSEGTQIYVELKRYYDLIEMVIKDNGIGIFTKIQQDCHLDDPLQAIFELAKGKLTTEPEDHTGEGIFFVSRMCNGFLILSHELSFGHNEYDVDVMLEETDSEDWDGTIVWMKILPKKHKNMQKVFKKYSADGDFGFTKTIIPVSLAKYGDENLVSRSQAKRIMYRFEKFKAVVLDFQNVEIIGQSFADEIFRVYKNKNPDLNIVYINANKSVEDMIKHVELNTK